MTGTPIQAGHQPLWQEQAYTGEEVFRLDTKYKVSPALINDSIPLTRCWGLNWRGGSHLNSWLQGVAYGFSFNSNCWCKKRFRPTQIWGQRSGLMEVGLLCSVRMPRLQPKLSLDNFDTPGYDNQRYILTSPRSLRVRPMTVLRILGSRIMRPRTHFIDAVICVHILFWNKQ